MTREETIAFLKSKANYCAAEATECVKSHRKVAAGILIYGIVFGVFCDYFAFTDGSFLMGGMSVLLRGCTLYVAKGELSLGQALFDAWMSYRQEYLNFKDGVESGKITLNLDEE